MQACKKSFAIILSFCLLLTAVSACFLGGSMSASADGVPQASFTYDFTDTEVFREGAVVDQIPGAIKVAVSESSGKPVTGAYDQMNIFTDADNTAGLGAGTQMLQIGSVATANGNWSEGMIILNHPQNEVISNSDTDKVIKEYPVTKISVDVRLPESDANRGGFVITKGSKVPVYDSENDQFTAPIAHLVYGLVADSTNGVSFYLNHDEYNYVFTPQDGKITGVSMSSFAQPSQYCETYTGSAAKSLGSIAIDAEGNSLSEDLVTVLNAYFAAKTTLDSSEYWVNIEHYALSDSKMESIITFNFSDYAALRESNPTLPEKLRIALSKADTAKTNWAYNKGSNEAEFSGFGMISGSKSRNGAAISNITIEYDVSSYYGTAAEEFKTSFAEGYATVVGANGYFDQSDLQAVTALLNTYTTLDEGVKDLLADDADVAAMVAALESAKAALEDGAYYFDAFEHGLNYEVISQVVNDVEKNIGSSSAPNYVNIKDNLTPTNVYSAEAASDGGDSSGNAFWGIHTDTTNAANNALWLRKSFNEYNMRPNQSGDRQGWPSVLYTLKDGVLPEGAQIQKVTGKMWHYSAYSDKRTMGVVHEYTDEYHWKAAVVSSARIFKLEKQSESAAHCDRNTGYYLVGTEERNSIADLKYDQWLDFSMEYSTEYHCYIFTLSGLNNSDEPVSYSVMTQECEPTTKFALVHGAPTQQCFDDIAVTLKDYVDLTPDTLGAKILKQPTENGDQNLRIDFDFSNTIANGADKNIVEYGAILQAGTQERETLTDAENQDRTVLAMPVTGVSEIPQTFIVTITNSAENSGKRVSAIAYVKDAEGNYYYSDNTNEVVENGLAVKSVMGVMKAWYLDVSTTDADGIEAAAEAYKAADVEQELEVAEILAKVADYANGTITTESPDYALCKELLSNIFHYYYNAEQA